MFTYPLLIVGLILLVLKFCAVVALGWPLILLICVLGYIIDFTIFIAVFVIAALSVTAIQ